MALRIMHLGLTLDTKFVRIVLFANNAWVYWNGLGVVWLAAGTALALTAQACFAARYTFSVLRDQNEMANPDDPSY